MNYNNQQTNFFGVPKGLYYGQTERIDELNDRIYMRNIPDEYNMPNFSPRPTPTKYSHFPIVQLRKQSTVKLDAQSQQENPTTTPTTPPQKTSQEMNAAKIPQPETRVEKPLVDIENFLRNQNELLQHGTIQNKYIPSSKSDLYKVSVIPRPSQQPYPDLFRKESYATSGEQHVANTTSQPSGRAFLNSTSVRISATP